MCLQRQAAALRMQRIGAVRLSRKASLLAAATGGALPSVLEDVREAALLPGYIASLTPDAAYVRCVASCPDELYSSIASDQICAIGVLDSCRAYAWQRMCKRSCWFDHPSTCDACLGRSI